MRTCQEILQEVLDSIEGGGRTVTFTDDDIEELKEVLSHGDSNEVASPVQDEQQPCYVCEGAKTLYDPYACDDYRCESCDGEGFVSKATDGEILKRVLVSLTSALSLLERGGKQAAGSDRLFEQMLGDYRRAVDSGRASLAAHRTARPA